MELGQKHICIVMGLAVALKLAARESLQVPTRISRR